MKNIKVPIFTEEYKIEVEITKNIKDEFRGRAFNRLPDKNPLIKINGDLSYYTALATLAHEASHAMDYIEEYLGLEDPSGEFHAHGIGAVMRIVGKSLKK